MDEARSNGSFAGSLHPPRTTRSASALSRVLKVFAEIFAGSALAPAHDAAASTDPLIPAWLLLGGETGRALVRPGGEDRSLFGFA
jgi:hypothetical protein